MQRRLLYSVNSDDAIRLFLVFLTGHNKFPLSDLLNAYSKIIYLHLKL